jgi:hypothetical protein
MLPSALRPTAAGSGDAQRDRAYISIRQHTPVQAGAYGSIRQLKSEHTAAYVSIPGDAQRDRGPPFSPPLSGRSRPGTCPIHTSAYVSIRQHTSAYVSICQHTSAYVSIRQHMSAYVSIRQHTSAHVSIRQHTSAYVSMRQHTTAYVSIRENRSDPGCKISMPSSRAQAATRSPQSRCSSISTSIRGTASISQAGGCSSGHGYTPGGSLRQHTPAYISIRQHTSAYVSTRQHTPASDTSAYVR